MERMSNTLLLDAPNFLLEDRLMSKNYLREIRKMKHLTLQQLAEAVGTSNQQVSNHEAGKRKLTWQWLEKYAAALNCHPLEIMQGPGQTFPNAQEKELLDLFRQIPDGERARYIGYLEGKIEKK
jgi:transcriptional regulator with XRE-family HTH domain